MFHGYVESASAALAVAGRLIPLSSINTRYPLVRQTMKSGDHAASVVLNAAIYEGSQSPATTSLVFQFSCQMFIVVIAPETIIRVLYQIIGLQA